MRNKTHLLLLAAALGYAQSRQTGPERSLPSFFIPNRGLTDASIQYFVATPELRAGFAADSVVFQVHDLNLRVRFAGANPAVKVNGEDQIPARANFLIGNHPEQWQTNLPLYQKILYRDLYPGIDMTYVGVGRRIKSEFLVAPGANPNQIRLEYSGADRYEIEANGDLLIRSEHMEVREEAPIVYQENSTGARVQIDAHYRLIDAQTLGFELGAYDASSPLVIDPVLSYATYLGGGGMSAVTGIALDSSGNLYVTGWTEATDFHIVGPAQGSNAGGVDVFIGKLNAAGTAFVYATYIGGRGDDRAAAIAVDASGQAYVTGSTASTNFPLVSSLRPTLGGTRDAFALKLNSVGNTLLYSTYLGGSSTDTGNAIAVDVSGNAYVAGDTLSADFPVSGAAQTTLGGQTDAFVTKLTPAGARSFATFLGGSAVEHAAGIAVDSSGNVYVAGGTNSTNFPVLGPIQAANGGSQDAFLTKIKNTGSQFLYSTYFGGNGGGAGVPEQANAVAVDAAGNAYIAGVTNSSNLPTTAGAFQGVFNGVGVQDTFVAKVNAAGNGLLYSTYLRGTSFDWANALAIDSSGNAYIAGYTSSSSMATVAPVQGVFKGLYDAFVAKLNPQGNGLSFSSFYGGTGSDVANAIAVDASGNMFVGGQTSSLDLPLQTPIQASNIGGSVGWVARFGVTTPPVQVPATISVSPSSGSGNTVTFTAQYSHPAGTAAIVSSDLLLSTAGSSDYSCRVTYTPATDRFALVNDVASSGSSVVIPYTTSAQNNQCILNGPNTWAQAFGNTLTLHVSLTFLSGFTGAKTVYLSANDATIGTGWVARGAWTVVVPTPPPTAVSANPSSGVGTFPTYTFLVSDPTSGTNITSVGVLLTAGTPVNTVSACYVIYNRSDATVGLVGDDGVSFSNKPAGSSATLQNSQCAVGYAAASVSGNLVQVTLQLLYKTSFFGAKNIYLLANEAGGVTSGWVNVGTWTAAYGVPSAISVSPSSGAGVFPTYTFTVSDPVAAVNLSGVAALVTPGAITNTVAACYVVFNRASSTVSVYGDDGVSFSSKALGSSATLQNSQCAVGFTAASVSGTSLVFTLQLLYKSSFFGAKNVYLLGTETGGVSSGWVKVGTWIAAYGIPTADSVTPSSGTGIFPTYVFTATDPVAAVNISTVAVLVSSGLTTNTTSVCYVVYNRTNSTVGLYADDGVSFSSKAAGSSSTLQNSQCAIGYAGVTVSGNSVQLTLQILYRNYPGAKTVYLQASEISANSGWVARGTWTPQ